MKQFGWKLIGLVLVSGVLTSCKGDIQELKGKLRPEKRVSPIEVSAIKIKHSKDVLATPYVGKVTPSKSAQINSVNGGRVQSILVQEGDQVALGDTLAYIESTLAQSSYDMAKAKLTQAQDGYDRMIMVYNEGGVTEVKKIEVETQLAEAKAAYASANDALHKCWITAPYNGVVDELFVEEGVEIPNMQAILKLLNAQNVEIHFPVPENEISDVSVGMQATIEAPAIEQTFTGYVTNKGVSAFSMSHTYNCILQPQGNLTDLLPGMFCKVYIQKEKNGLIVIPMQAVMTDDLGQYLWTAHEGVVAKTRIKIDGFSTEGVIIKEGLQEGDYVITEGRRKISSGMKVKINIEEES